MTNLFHLKSKTRKTPGHPPFQIMHIRYIDREDQEIYNFGGYTLAYRATFDKSLRTLQITYAYAECNETDNFNRKTGVSIASHRLNNEAESWIEYFEAQLDEAADPETTIYALDDEGTVDVQESAFNLRKAVIDNFFSAVLEPFYGAGLYDHLVQIGKSTYLSRVLLGHGGDEEEDDDVLDVTRQHFQAILDAVESYRTSNTNPSVTAAAVWKAMDDIAREARAGLAVEYAGEDLELVNELKDI